MNARPRMSTAAPENGSTETILIEPSRLLFTSAETAAVRTESTKIGWLKR
jgi:hypothetical protein